MIKTIATDSGTTKALLIQSTDEGPIPIGGTLANLRGTFKSTSRTSAGTSIITSPALGKSIVLTDLIVGTDKVNGATITVQFTDGTDTIEIYSGNATDAPINVAIAFAGNWAGWKDARVEMVTTNALKATVAVGYYKLDTGQTYEVWDSFR